MRLLRTFISDNPDDSGLIISGRTYFFDSSRELETAMNIRIADNIGRGNNRRVFIKLSLMDFNEEQLGQYLRQNKWPLDVIPAWLPSRPLLVGYLASRHLVGNVAELGSALDPADGWDKLLTLVCNREARAEVRVDGTTVRRLIEHLATKARQTSEGLGPLGHNDIVSAFEHVVGSPPDGPGYALIQRLPGLGVADQEENKAIDSEHTAPIRRKFIDSDFADTAAAGSVIRFIANPHDSDLIQESQRWSSTLRQLGMRVVARHCQQNGFTAAQISAAAKRARLHGRHGTLTADILQVLIELDLEYQDKSISVEDTVVDELMLGKSNKSYANIEFSSCSFRSMELELSVQSDLLPSFRECYFGFVEGRTSQKEMPLAKFIGCEFDTFDDAAVNSDRIMDLPLKLSQRVLLTILKKLYRQRGSGRQDSALRRSIPQEAVVLVNPLLTLLQQEKLIVLSKSSSGRDRVWIPDRASTGRVLALLDTPNPNDPLLRKAGEVR